MEESNMKPTAEWQREATIKSLIEHWEPTALLDGLNNNDKDELVLWYDNQYLWNKVISAEDDRYEQFKRLSIPLIRRIYCGMNSRNLVSVRTMVEPTQLMQIWKDGKVGEYVFSTISKKLGMDWRLPRKCQADGIQNLDAEAELCAIMALDISMDIDREITRDLTNNAQFSTIDCAEPHLSFKDIAKALCDEIERIGVDLVERTGSKGQLWAVTSQEVFALVQLMHKSSHEEEPYNSLGLSFRQKCGNVKFYVDSLYPTNTLLMGLKAEDPRVSGYYFNPYIMTPIFKTAPQKEQDFSFETDTENLGFLHRYSKHMTPSGSLFYQRINLMNFMV